MLSRSDTDPDGFPIPPLHQISSSTLISLFWDISTNTDILYVTPIELRDFSVHLIDHRTNLIGVASGSFRVMCGLRFWSKLTPVEISIHIPEHSPFCRTCVEEYRT